MSAAAETMEFRTELKQLLHLITHSLYSNREIFLRELISNASDAINKARFDSLDREDVLEGNKDWKIELIVDKAAGTLTVRDNGVGMDRAAAEENLGTIAKSGTRAFLDAVGKDGKAKPDLIGQFGVGFYSAFMVADKVSVLSRPAGSPEDGVFWVSDGQGSFSIQTATKADRGTDVVLQLKDDAKNYLEEWELKGLVKKFSDFVEHPVVMDVEREKPAEEGKEPSKSVERETLNSRKALWLRHKNEVSSEEYNEFYKQISNDYTPPAKVLHYLIEGGNEYRAILFIPAKKPFAFEYEEPKGVRLYIQRVLIMEKCDELLPPYLRWVSGVVDSSDLPLNISRELLQSNPLLAKIQKSLVKNVLDGLEGMKNTEEDAYRTFFDEFGSFLKQGLGNDYANQNKIADLMLYPSLKTPADKRTTLAEYVEKMPEGQQDILFLTGESREQLEASPLLEGFKAKGWDVLLLSDPMDEFSMPALREYKGKKLRAVDKGDADETPAVEDAESFTPLIDKLKALLPEVKDVKLTGRLNESAACLVAEQYGPSANFERLMKRAGRDVNETKRVLEINPSHPTVQLLRDLAKDGGERFEDYGRLVYDLAVVAEGSKVRDPGAFARRLNDLIRRDAGRA